jgi:hypothetical protein
LITFACFVAVVLIDGLRIRAETFLGAVAPEEAVVGMGDGRVPFGLNEHALPAKEGTAVVVTIEPNDTGKFHGRNLLGG